MYKKITGVMMYYYKVCHRKLWYFYNEIEMEHTNENVSIGKAIDEKAYQREDKHINIDNVINIDYIKTKKVLHEVKKSKKIESASVFQVKYYLYYLRQRGVSDVKAKIDYPILKQTVEVILNDKDIVEIEDAIKDIKVILDKTVPPELNKKRICKSCAYYELCYI